MGHYCYVCGRIRPNEAFSGRGHRTHVCRKCKPITRTQEWKDTQAQHEIFNYLRQKNISKRNQKRLQELCASANATIAEQAQLVLKVSRIQSHKHKRIRNLRRSHPDLCDELIHAELISPDNWQEIESEEELFFEEFAERSAALLDDSEDEFSDNDRYRYDYESDIPF